VSIKNGGITSSVEVVNVGLVPLSVFHNVLFNDGFSSVRFLMFDDSKSLDIEYFIAAIVTLEKLLSNCVQNIVADMRFDGSVRVYLTSIQSRECNLVFITWNDSNFLWFLLKRRLSLRCINVHQVGEVVQMAVLVWVVFLDISVSLVRCLNGNSWNISGLNISIT